MVFLAIRLSIGLFTQRHFSIKRSQFAVFWQQNKTKLRSIKIACHCSRLGHEEKHSTFVHNFHGTLWFQPNYIIKRRSNVSVNTEWRKNIGKVKRHHKFPQKLFPLASICQFRGWRKIKEKSFYVFLQLSSKFLMS